LHPDQLLVRGDRLYILDLDLFSGGDPALDLGNLVAHLSEYALRRLGDPNALAKQQSQIIDTYESLAGIQIRSRTDIYAALTLARLVQISTVFEDRLPFTEQILAHAEGRLGELQ
jgi:aminoglycoside phosphotransferase (APT) family kinase protein